MTVTFARWTRPFLGLAVTALCFWLLSRQLHLDEIRAALAHLSLLPLLAALGFLAAGYAVRIVRWWWMLRVLDSQIPLGACGWPFLVSISLNNLLPFRLGDAVRVFGFRMQLRSPAMHLLGTLAIERLLDLMTLLAFFFIGLLGVSSGRVPETFISLTLWIAIAGVIAVLVILLFSRWLQRLVHCVAEHPQLLRRGWSQKIKHHSSQLFHALGLLRTPGLALQLIALSFALWGLEGTVFAIVANALDTKISGAGAWFALATGTLATLLPSSPGYFGTFDYFTMLGLVAYEADRGIAAACAVIVHLVLWLPLTVAGIGYFLRPGSRMLRLKVAAALSGSEDPT